MKIIYMPVPKNYEIEYDHIIFRYNDILCLKASELNDDSSSYKLVFYDINKRIYFDYCNIKKITDKYELKDWYYLKECHMFYILAIEEQTRQSTVIEINMENSSCTEKAIDILSEDIINGYYYLMYNGEEMLIYNYDTTTETYTYYNYKNNTYGLSIRDIFVTGDIRGFCYICSYENRIIINLEGENINIFDENICYFSCEERFDLFLDVCIDTKSINILNDYKISKNKYIEHMVFKENTLIFSENPYEEEMCSGLEKYYSYNLDNKQLKELNTGDKYIPFFFESHDKELYISALRDDSEILRLSDMKVLYKEEIFEALKNLDEEILKYIPVDDYNFRDEWYLDEGINGCWWFHTHFIETQGKHGQDILIEIDTMKAYIFWGGLIGIIDDTIYAFETPSEED